MMCNKKQLWEYLVLLFVKNHLLMHFVESPWLKCFNLHLCPRVVLHSKKQFSQEILLELVEKTKQFYVLPCLEKCISTTSFDL
jgi:acyl-CoA synthetase (AMP-forming)/AMP-acid ligase II